MLGFVIFAAVELHFYKYQGTGNDFVILDNRQQNFPKNDTKLIAQLCDRKFGIGADGLLLLENNTNCDFTMVYYNADGNVSSMCGNGGRCIVHFAKHLTIIEDVAAFEAVDGSHSATIKDGIVSLKMNDVTKVLEKENGLFLDTGSPHHIKMVPNTADIDVFKEGKHIRNSVYGNEGANINFVSTIANDIFSVRTYERGVEDETLSCGTGVTAVAIAMHYKGLTAANKVQLNTPGGVLKVSFNKTETIYKDVYLEGPATMVYKGVWNL